MDLPWLSSDETVTAWSRMSEERVEGVALCIQAARLESREKGNASMANSVHQSGDGAKKGKLAVLFEDLSIAQVIAGALAAATVFLLSSVIGVAGSLIGAAVGSFLPFPLRCIRRCYPLLPTRFAMLRQMEHRQIRRIPTKRV